MGGLDYTVRDIIYALLEDAREGLGSRKTLGARRSAGETQRAAVVHALRCIGRNGKRRCLQDGEALDVFPRPNEKLRLFALRAKSLLSYRMVPEAAREAVAVHLASDDKSFGDYHAKGTLVTFIKLEDDPGTADEYGVCGRSRVTNSLALPLPQNSSKVVKTVVRRPDGAIGQLVLGCSGNNRSSLIVPV